MARYEGFTLDGSLLFSRDTAQAIGDAVAWYIGTNQRPHLAFTFDNGPVSFPYTTWKRDNVLNAYVGTQHSTFEEMLRAVRSNAAEA